MENPKFKYKTTLHLPFSQGVSRDDKILKSVSHFVGKRVVVTEKMDGENTSMYSDYIHARSVDGNHHPSRDWVKGYWGTVKDDIPFGWRICAENMYARHSIYYPNLKSYLYGLSVWDETNTCLAWDDTVEWFKLLGIVHPTVLFDGLFDEKIVKDLWKDEYKDTMEGYVMRVADTFSYEDFSDNVAKFVRLGHVQTDSHWMHAEIVPNGLKKPQ